ncbi:MAG: hypothetical protein GVY18_04475 [Bacteroidetes bacterium]|nr:hypothetical protein [Bacteroidota bacterium]
MATNLAGLFDGDRGYFALPLSETHYVFPEHLSPSVLQTYPDYIRRFNRRYGTWTRAVALGVHGRRALFDPWWDEIMSSMYMQDFVPTIRGYSSICASVLIDEDQAPGADSVAQIVVHYDTAQDASDEAKNASLMRLLYPAFAAGLRTFTTMHQHRHELDRTIDALRLATLLCDADGRPLHRTPALNRLLKLDPERSTVREEILDLARRFTRDTAGNVHETLKTASGTVVQTAQNTYHLHATAAPAAFGIDGSVLIALRAAHRPPATMRALERQFDLTPQQARVALLLAQRNTNREIAEALYISPHTARHHTEQVLRKLGISSRREVKDAILNDSCPGK